MKTAKLGHKIKVKPGERFNVLVSVKQTAIISKDNIVRVVEELKNE